MTRLAIRVEGLGKRYRLGERARYGSLRGSLAKWLREPAALLRGRDEAPHVWSLREVSFEVGHGEVLGIIGRNGAGKSTLLKILSRITEPTEGRAEIHGRAGSLLEVGTGFHPELTGRENIFLNGAILGMRKREVDRKFDEIVAFAEVERFLDTMVKHYSSGMYVRLAFAVAAHLEPEILLVDEVLAVGDAAFQKKCLGKMSEKAKGGRTVLFVSHSAAAVAKLCPRTLWIDGGRVRMLGPTGEVMAAYLTSDAGSAGTVSWPGGTSTPGIDDWKLLRVSVQGPNGAPTSRVDARQAFTVAIEYEARAPIVSARVGFILRTAEGAPVCEVYDSDDEAAPERREPGLHASSCTVPGHLLNPGRFVLSVNAGIPNVRNLVSLDSVLVFDVEDTASTGSGAHLPREGAIRPRLEWRREIVSHADPHR